MNHARLDERPHRLPHVFRYLPLQVLAKLLRRWLNPRNADSAAWKELKGKHDSDNDDAADVSRCLIVGLGNPGNKHRNNRHNIGYMILDSFAKRMNISLTRTQKKAQVGTGSVGDRPVVLAKPQTYMNLSGDSVGPLAEFYRISPDRILVIYDELDLPLGTIRLRERGGAGGHNGMRSIIRHLGQGFPRLRIGIGRPPGKMPPAAYVLQDFNKEETELLAETISESHKAIETFLSEGIEIAMTRHNGPVS